MDASSPLALASVPILLLPIGRVRKSTWDSYTAHFTSVQSVPQSDVPLDGSVGAKARFFPSLSSTFASSSTAGTGGGALVKANNNNALHLAWTLSPLDDGAALGLLRPSSQPLAVIALVDLHPLCTPSLPIATSLLKKTLDDLYPAASSGRPMVVRCFGVEGEGGAEQELVIDSSDGLAAQRDRVTVVPKIEEPRAFLEALVGEMLGGLLAEFANVATLLESPSGMALLQQHSLPPLSLAASIPTSTPSRPSSPSPVPQFSLLRGETLPTRTGSPLARQQPQLGTGHPSTPNFSAVPVRPESLQRSTTSSNLRDEGRQQIEKPPEAPPPGPVKTSFGGVGRKRVPSSNPPALSPVSLPSAPQLNVTASNSATIAALPLAAARLASVLGSLYLLAGRLGDAQQSYLDALSQLSKLPAALAGAGDSLWQGATLEGLAISSLLIECKPKSPASKDAVPPAPAHEAISTHLDSALAAYHRAGPIAATGGNPFPELYVNCALRHARLLVVLRQRGQLAPFILPFLPLPPGPIDGPPSPPSVPAISKTQAAQVAGAAHGPWLFLLPASDRLAALRVLVGVSRALGMRRKEGMYARMVVGCLAEMLVLARIAAASAAPTENAGVGVRVDDGKEGNAALLELVDSYLLSYGVDVEAPGGVFIGEGEREVKAIRGGAEQEALRVGWPELQLRALRDSIALAETLPDHHSVTTYALTLLQSLRSFLPAGEQAHLASVISRAVGVARRRGELKGGDRLRFWGGWVVMSLEVAPLPATSIPIQHDLEDRQTTSSSAVVRDPFLFNPRVIARLGASTVVQGEAFDVFVTLQNEFAFPLEVQNVRLSTTGPEIVCDPLAVLLAPNSVQSVKLSAFATAPGKLTIKGCVVRLTDGSEAEFLLPVHDQAEEKRQRKRASKRVDEERALKMSGLSRVLGDRAKRDEGGGKEEQDATFLTCEVLPEQPRLRIRGTSLTHGAMMLYAGEETKVRITLENTGHLPVNFLKLSFQNSTTAADEASLADGELSAGEAYELESSLVHQPVFRCTAPAADESVRIEPRSRYTAVVTCRGKLGCAWGNVQVSYGFVDGSREGSEREQGNRTSFYTRQITLPILMSVFPTLECAALDILRLPSLPSASPTPDEAGALVRALRTKDGQEQCLVALDVRNVYSQPFEVTFSRRSSEHASLSDREGASSTRLISPGATERILLPLPRLLLPPSQTAAPIPALTDRQFVLSARAKAALAAPGEEGRTRALFWYREALLAAVEATWRDPASGRTGLLSLRAQSLTQPMLDVLRLDEVAITLAVVAPSHGAAEAAGAGGQRPVQADEFFEVVVTVRNRLSRPLTPLIHLSTALPFAAPSAWSHTPSASLSAPPSATGAGAPSASLVASGLPAQTLAGERALAAGGGEARVRFALGVLARGTVGVRVCVEDVGGRPRRRGGRRRLLAAEEGAGEEGKGRKVWEEEAEDERGVWFSDVLAIDVV